MRTSYLAFRLSCHQWAKETNTLQIIPSLSQPNPLQDRGSYHSCSIDFFAFAHEHGDALNQSIGCVVLVWERQLAGNAVTVGKGVQPFRPQVVPSKRDMRNIMELGQFQLGARSPVLFDSSPQPEEFNNRLYCFAVPSAALRDALNCPVSSIVP